MAKGRRGPSYGVYVRDYLIKEKKMARQGYTMQEGMLSKQQFKEVYTIYKYDYEEDVRLGDRKTTSNITRDIIASQAYKGRSHKQARHVYDYVRELRKREQEQFSKFKEKAEKTLSKLDPEQDASKIGKIKESIYKKKQEMKTYKYSYAQIRRGDIDWTVVQEYRKDLSAQGFSKKQIAQKIGQTFFGSPI